MKIRKRLVYFAARDGMVKCLSALLHDFLRNEMIELIEQEEETYQGETLTPLIVASRNGHVDVVKQLVTQFNADTEHVGCVKVDNYRIQGATALWCAAGAGHLNVVKVLVQAGANVNHTTSTNSTPLRAACFDGRLDIVKYLIEHGALVNISNKYNNSCLMIASYKDMTPVLAAAERTKAEVVEYFINECELCINDRIDALELLGASFANDKDNYNIAKTFEYLQKAMTLRYSGEIPILKPQFEPIPAYENWVECKTMEELNGIQLNENALHMESLTIRERILGINNPELPHPVIYRGAVFADNGRFDRCLDLWLHGLKLYQLNETPVVKDLLRFAQIFSQMVRVGVEIDIMNLELVLRAATKELERNKNTSFTLQINEDILLEREDYECNVISTLYTLSILSKLIDNYSQEQTLRIHQIVFELNKLNPKTRNGQSLLHLAVNEYTPVDSFHTNDVCRFPCASTAELLVKCGADVNALDNERNSPLHVIATYQNPVRDFLQLHNIISLLINSGAHVDIVNNQGKMAVDAATIGTTIILKIQNKPSLMCLAARAINMHHISYRELIPASLLPFVELHGPKLNTNCSTEWL